MPRLYLVGVVALLAAAARADAEQDEEEQLASSSPLLAEMANDPDPMVSRAGRKRMAKLMHEISIAQDVMDRHLYQEAHAANEKMFRKMVKKMGQVITDDIVTDVSKITQASNAFNKKKNFDKKAFREELDPAKAFSFLTAYLKTYPARQQYNAVKAALVAIKQALNAETFREASTSSFQLDAVGSTNAAGGEESESEERCKSRCEVTRACCNANSRQGANMFMSCLQGCMARASGVSRGDCEGSCDATKRSCTRSFHTGISFHLCGSCSDVPAHNGTNEYPGKTCSAVFGANEDTCMAGCAMD